MKFNKIALLAAGFLSVSAFAQNKGDLINQIIGLHQKEKAAEVLLNSDSTKLEGQKAMDKAKAELEPFYSQFLKATFAPGQEIKSCKIKSATLAQKESHMNLHLVVSKGGHDYVATVSTSHMDFHSRKKGDFFQIDSHTKKNDEKANQLVVDITKDPSHQIVKVQMDAKTGSSAVQPLICD